MYVISRKEISKVSSDYMNLQKMLLVDILYLTLISSKNNQKLTAAGKLTATSERRI